MVSYHIFLPWCTEQITEKFSLHSEQIRPHVNAIKSFFSWPCAWKKELCFASISLFSRPLHVLFFPFSSEFSFPDFLTGVGSRHPRPHRRRFASPAEWKQGSCWQPSSEINFWLTKLFAFWLFKLENVSSFIFPLDDKNVFQYVHIIKASSFSLSLNVLKFGLNLSRLR